MVLARRHIIVDRDIAVPTRPSLPPDPHVGHDGVDARDKGKGVSRRTAVAIYAAALPFCWSDSGWDETGKSCATFAWPGRWGVHSSFGSGWA